MSGSVDHQRAGFQDSSGSFAAALDFERRLLRFVHFSFPPALHAKREAGKDHPTKIIFWLSTGTADPRPRYSASSTPEWPDNNSRRGSVPKSTRAAVDPDEESPRDTVR